LKSAEIARRRSIKERNDAEHAEAIEAGDLEKAYSKATMTSRLTREMTDEARVLLGLMGLPVAQAPAEGEAQASHMAKAGIARTAALNADARLLLAAPRPWRFLTISAREFMPSKGAFRPKTTELIDSAALLDAYKLTLGQLAGLAVLAGTDFTDRINGIGQKK